MSRENVETIARLYDEFLAKPERLASPELLAFFDPAVEIHQSESLLGTQGIGKESGIRVSETVAHVWTLKGGRIMAWDVYLDPAEGLEAVGLSE